jgi:serpin B
MATTAEAINEFAFQLYRALGASSGGNLFISPYSIAAALMMAAAGARGSTQAELIRALHIEGEPAQLLPALAALTHDLTATSQPIRNQSTPFTLRTASALWAQSGLDFRAEFMSQINALPAMTAHEVDFGGQPRKTADRINTWVAEQTEQRIRQIVSADNFSALTALVLTSAIYFMAAWVSPFRESATKTEPFHPLQGKPVRVPTMRQQEDFRYGRIPGAQIVALPYYGRDVSLLILLPDPGQFESFERGLTAQTLRDAEYGLATAKVDLSLPRFRFEAGMSLKASLSALGIKEAFSKQADFSGIASQRVGLDDVLHKTFVAVDEKGTEAAAATAVIAVVLGAMARPRVVRLKIDRPFIFVIHDHPTGVILFAGRVTNPSGN